MYIYVNKDGQIKEVVNDLALRQANDNINHIYLYCEDLPVAEVAMGLIRYKLPNGVITPEIQFSLDTVSRMIPYDKKRDLKYFKDYTEYDFYDIVIPDGSDPLIPNVLGETGLVEFTARFVDTANQTIYALQTATFYVEDSIVKKTEFITGDQYNYLLRLITYISSDVVANPIGEPSGNLYTIKIGEIIYKVSIDRYLKSITVDTGTDRKTYTFKNEDDEETEIITPINWLVNAILTSGGYVTVNRSDGTSMQFNVPDDDYIVDAMVEGGAILKLTKKDGTVVEFVGGGGSAIDDYCDGAEYNSTTHVLTITFADSRTPTVVSIPYLTSQLTNDSGFIGNSTLANYYLKTEIDALPISHFDNDENYITIDVTNLTNYTKTSDLATVATTGSYTDLLNLPEIVDNLTTASATKILSANQGFEINKRLQAVEGLGRFLAVWDAEDGYPEDLPPADMLPYELKNGDYYIVGNVGSGTNYKPHVTMISGKGYFIDDHSTDVESTPLHNKDIYIYDGANKEFRLLTDSTGDIYWANIKGSDVMDNAVLAAALNAKQDELVDSDDIKIISGVVTFVNASGYVTYTDFSVASGSHLTYNATTGEFGVATNYEIPLSTKIAQIDTNTEDIADLSSQLDAKQNASGNTTLTTTDKTIVGAINEIDAAVKGLDFSSFQTKIDATIIVPTEETDKTVVGAINWLYSDKLSKNANEALLQPGDTVYTRDSVGNIKRVRASELGASYVGKLVCSHTLTTVEQVIAAEGGIYWEKISDFDDCGMYEWERTDILPPLDVDLTTTTLELEETIGATWGVEYKNTLVVATAGLSLPDTIVIKVGGNTLTVDDDYEYDSSTGMFVIHPDKVKGDIEIIAEAE